MDIHNNRMPKFAVLLAAYNGMSFITQQIDTILSQINVDVHLFISVDKSSDGTEAFLMEWARVDHRITLLPAGGRFGGAAKNFYRLFRDVDFTEYDYVSLSDQDDIWAPSKLWRAHISMLEKDALGYSSNASAFWPSGKILHLNKAQQQRSWDYMFEAAGPGCTYVLQKRLAKTFQDIVLEQGESLSNIEYHDWLIYAFARANNISWAIDSCSSILYRQHANNQIGANTGLRSVIKRFVKMIGGHGFAQSILIVNAINISSASFVMRGLFNGRRGYMYLAFHARQCRRKRLDQIYFFILCFLFAIINPSLKK